MKYPAPSGTRTGWRAAVWAVVFFAWLATPAAAQDRAIGVEAAYTAPVSDRAPAGNAGLFVGINTFTDDRGIRPLKYAVNDAVAQAHLFVNELRLIPPGNAFLALAGEPSTDTARQQLAALRAAGVQRIAGRKTTVLRQLLLVEKLPTAASDLVVVSISSHGFEEDGTAYAMPTDGLRGILGDTAIDLQTVERRLARSKAGKRLLILDACRERPSAQGKGGDLPMTAAFRAALASSSGQAVLASCDAGQLSYENDQLGHGVFTYYLLSALRGQAAVDGAGHITLGSVSDHVSAKVRDWAVRHRPGVGAAQIQRPWFKGPNDARDIPLAIRKTGERLAPPSPVAPAPAPDRGVGVGSETDQILARLADFDRQRQEALKNYLPTSSYVGKIERARADYLAQSGPKVLTAYEAALATLAELSKEMRSTAPPVVAVKRQIATLGPVAKPLLADDLVRRAAAESDTPRALALLDQALKLVPGMPGAQAYKTQRIQRQKRADIEAQLRIARTNNNHANGKTALRALRQVLILDPHHSEALVLRKTISMYYFPKKVGDTWTNSVGMELAYIPSGSFRMGSPAGEGGRYDDERQFMARLTKPFLMGVTEVTQDQWESVMGNNPSRFKGDDLPVEYVSWDDAVSFCRKLSIKEGLSYRLPTESEWEYGCRAGTTSAYYGGDDESDLARVGWYDGNAGGKTHAVGQKASNAWGLYDMHGNVWEWCSDWKAEYPRGSVSDPTGASQGDFRVLRGGAWNVKPRICRAANRSSNFPGFRSYNFGFRVVVGVPSPGLSE